jgi:Dyp-type peroxidase family
LLIVAANNETAADARADELVASAAQAGLLSTYREMARRIEDLEHFGFRDGIAQPRVLGDAPDGKLGAGHFVFGYPRAAGDAPFSPTIDPSGITKNGSLLVFRRLKQDVRVFRQFCADEAHRLAAQWPQLSKERLAALLVGRWPSGAPVKASASQDPGGSPPDDSFDFHDDPDSLSCPFGAHIRKVNPRNGRKDVVEVPRLLRRGIPFGPRFEVDPNAERGLIFLAFQTSIKSQFEFMTQHWMNSPLNPAPGHDLLVGRSEDPRSLKIMGPNGPIEVLDGGQEWIRPAGGAYLFAPSRSGLAKFGTSPASLGWWKARQLFAIASHNVRLAAFGDTVD